MKLKEVNKNSCCRRCIYFLADVEGRGVSCAAFLDKIPKKYLDGSAVHRKKEPGQIGDAIYTPEPEVYRR